MAVSTANPYIIGVSGGSGSGKTYFARALQKHLGAEFCEIVYQDNFYFDQSSNFDFDGGKVNFDHPASIDFDLLAEKLGLLREQRPAFIPVYDFVTHSRKDETLRIDPKPIILVDGILIFHSSPVRKMFDDLIFFDTPEDLRFQRRLDRDVRERGRTPQGVRNEFYQQVKPMHDAFVEPSKIHARVRVHYVGEFDDVLGAFVKRLSKVCGK